MIKKKEEERLKGNETNILPLHFDIEIQFFCSCF
jgi:hypothetical protein